MSFFDKGAAIGAKASELIEGTPGGYVTIGSPLADIATRFGRYDNMPTRGTIQPVIDEVVTAMGPLSVSGTDQVGDTPTAILPNGAFHKLDLVGNDIDNWSGNAATAFHDNYEVWMPVVPQSQFIAASILVHSLEAEIDLWERVAHDVNDIADKTLAALEEADGKGDAGFTFELTVLAALATVGVTILSGGTAAPILLTVAAGAASSAAAAVPLAHDVPDPQGVIDAMVSGLNTVDTETVSKEQRIAQDLGKIDQIVTADLQKGSFAPSEFPVFKFKPVPLLYGPGGLGAYTPGA